MAGLEPANCVASAVGSFMISALVKQAFAKYDELGNKSKQMEEAKKKLAELIVPVETVLTAVNQGQIQVPGKALDDWIWQFRDAVEQAEDVLDEIQYHKLEHKVQAREGTTISGGGTVSIKKMITGLRPKTAADGIMKKLKGAVKGLEKVSGNVKPFVELATALNIRGKSTEQKSKSRETGSMLTESVVIGREKEKNAIFQWLENPRENIVNQNVSAYSVIGMGGMGKTTLAQLICHEIQEKKVPSFNQVVWVSVSDNFRSVDAKVILRKILEDVTKSSYDYMQNLNTLQATLKEKVLTKKFVIVIDDVWRDDAGSCEQWAQILAPLKFGRKGSRMIFTTRTESVADMITKLMEGSKMSDHMRLTGLDDDHTLQLLNKYAFSDVPEPDANLQRISKEIASKLGGCPLAAKVMGSLLNDHIDDFEYWERIWKQNISNLPSGEKGIMSVLRLSYHHLPAELQLCFRYCSIFPHQHKFMKDDLVKMWMGSGLFQWSKQSRRPEDIGGDLFDHLIRKSFFDVSRESEHLFIMHDLMHEMVASISSRECLRIEGVISKESIPHTTRHLFIQTEGLSSIKEISHLKHLRSLFIAIDGEQPQPEDILELNEVLKELKSLRLLSITGAHLFELPNHAGDLIHLRYISIKQMAKKALQWSPKLMSKLYHLEVLIIFAFAVTDISNTGPSGIGNLLNLRHLDGLDSMLYKFPWIGKLISLQKLEFNIWDEDGHKIGELKTLKKIQELNINKLDNVKSAEEADEAKMIEKNNLKSLSLYWSGDCSNSELILDTLRPHPHLQKLVITSYPGSQSPEWLKNGFLSNLVSLKLYSCSNWELLPPLGDLISLQVLWLTNFPKVKQITRSFYGCRGGTSFQSLRELRISSMPEWTDWVDLEETALLPRLEVLDLESCPQLRTLPKMPFSLKLLSARFCGLQSLPKISCSDNKTSNPDKPALSILRISQCPDIITLESGPLLQQELFQAFEEITIESCQKLQTLPSRGFSGLYSVKLLRIADCPNLMKDNLQENILPNSLGELWISECGLGEPLLFSLRDVSSLVRIDLCRCSNLKSLPPKEVFVKLTSLRDLRIFNCAQLSSLGGLGALVELTYVRIIGCDALVAGSSSEPTTEIGSCQLRIGELYISPPSLLQIEPLRSLRFTKKIGISWESQPELLPEKWMLQNSTDLEEIEIDNASSLKCVPPTIAKLKSLMKLTLSRANLIDSLPMLPDSLRVLVISGCNEVFIKQYKKDSGTNWNEIEDIPHVSIF